MLIPYSDKLIEQISVVRNKIEIMLPASHQSKDNDLAEVLAIILASLSYLENIIKIMTELVNQDELVANLSRINRESLARNQQLLKTLDENCHPLFELIFCSDHYCFNQTDNTTLIENLSQAIIASLTTKETQFPTFFPLLKQGLRDLREKAAIATKQKKQPKPGKYLLTNAARSNQLTDSLEKIHDKILEAADESFDDEAKSTFSTDSNGNYLITLPQEDMLVIQVKHMLNALIGLANNFHAWSSLNKTNILLVFAYVYQNVQYLVKSYQTLKEIFANAIAGNKVITQPLLTEINELLKQLAINADAFEINYSLAKGVISNQLNPALQIFVELLGQSDDYNYSNARIAALAKAKRKLHKDEFTLDFSIKKLTQANVILAKKLTDNAFSLTDTELQTISKTLPLLEITQQEKVAYKQLFSVDNQKIFNNTAMLIDFNQQLVKQTDRLKIAKTALNTKYKTLCNLGI